MAEFMHLALFVICSGRLGAISIWSIVALYFCIPYFSLEARLLIFFVYCSVHSSPSMKVYSQSGTDSDISARDGSWIRKALPH